MQKNILGKQEVFDRITEAVEDKVPFSLLRIGDGESMVIQGQTYPYKRQFGFIPDENVRKDIVKKLRTAYNKASIVGVPTIRHLSMSRYWESAEHCVRILGEKTSIDIHYDLKDFVPELVRGKEIAYISGRNIKTELEYVFDCKVDANHVTPEILFEKDKDQISHYPIQYNEMVRKIKNSNFYGKIVLVGAGFLGKIYCDMIKDSGGIALDMGSVFDMWAGKVTRGKNKGVDSYDNTHKL